VDENDMSNGVEDVIDVFEGWQEDETHNPDIPATSHRRGMAPFVFVPFEEVCETPSTYVTSYYSISEQKYQYFANIIILLLTSSRFLMYQPP
jgi:hypothetical protein